MTEPRIMRASDAKPHDLHGDGRILRLIYPGTVGSRHLFVGLAIVPPGEAPHVFHTHGVEVVGDTRLEYAPDFEEFYYVVEGDGQMQWKLTDGTIVQTPVSAGDSIFMPPDCLAHRIFNSGQSVMRVLYGGTPPARITKVESTQSEG